MKKVVGSCRAHGDCGRAGPTNSGGFVVELVQ